MRLRWWYISILIFFTLPVKGEVIELKKDFIVAEGSEYLEYYLSTDTVSSPQERYFQMKSSQYEKVKRYLFFTTQSQKWIYFEIKNPESIPFNLLVEMGNFGLNQVDYYIFHHDSIINQGIVATRGGLKTSGYYDRNIVIPFTAESEKSYSFLIRIHTNAPIFDLPIIIWNKSNKFAISQGIELGRGLFYGVLLFFVVVAGLIVLLIRTKSNIYFWLYLLFGGMLIVMKSGVPLEVFWPGRSYLDFVIRNFILYSYLLITLRFLKEFLSDKIQQGWYSTVLDIALTLGCVLLVLYLPFSYWNVLLQDSLLIVQTAYINLTNLLVIILLFWALPKVQDKFGLLISLLYYFIFSAYLFNPFIEFGFWTGKHVGHILLYTGGFVLAVLLCTVASVRMKIVIKRNQEMKHQLQNLNKKYSHSLVEGQEKQRKRVAEELHDGIGAHLSAVKMKLSALKTSVNDPSEIDTIDRIIENLDESTQQVREMSHELMPPTLKRYGLESAITDMIKKYQSTYPVKLYIKTNLRQNRLDAISETIVYRLLHQLFETLVHGHSQKAEIRLVILPSVSTATIQVKYSGGSPLSQNETEEFQDLKALVNLLQGKIEYFMSSIWDDELNIEIPIQLLEEEFIEVV